MHFAAALCGLDERALTLGFHVFAHALVPSQTQNTHTHTHTHARIYMYSVNPIPDWSSSIGQWVMELHRQLHCGDKSDESKAKILDSVASGNPPCKEWLESLMDYVEGTDASGAILRDIAHCAKVYAPSSATGVRLLGQVFMDRLNSTFNRVEGGKEAKAFPLFKAAIIKAQLTGPSVEDFAFPLCRDAQSGIYVQ